MSSKLTPPTESSASAPPPSGLYGSGAYIELDLPWSMPYYGFFEPAGVYDGYKADEVLDPSCTKFLTKGKSFFSTLKFMVLQVPPLLCWEEAFAMSTVRRFLLVTGSRQRDVQRWTNVGESIPTDGRPIYSSLEFLIFRIDNKGRVNSIRRISNFPTNPYGEGSNDVEVTNQNIGQLHNSSPYHPPSGTFQSHVIPSNPRNF
ncbi:hypothetical protein O181_004097 [Austropuccinia psidii MF-1]|uniref:Uncharacterized protein n=1 Tax=Austropuccinia psidii MF-1 TaxID=1389203 RepID=A0A9Q3GFG4_9BASI|nr:hypothetical protein [Austropuccinia psidii MF-1]